MAYMMRREAKLAHKVWRNRVPYERWDYLMMRGYRPLFGTLVRELTATEYDQYGDGNHNFTWHINDKLTKRELVDQHGRVWLRQYICG